MEAAVAYYEATGKDRLLKVMERMADHISDQFGPGKRTGIPGHQGGRNRINAALPCYGKRKI